MIVNVTWSWNHDNKGEVREYENLEDCIATLLDNEDFDGFPPQIIIRRPYFDGEEGFGCPWIAEVYNGYRE